MEILDKADWDEQFQAYCAKLGNKCKRCGSQSHENKECDVYPQHNIPIIFVTGYGSGGGCDDSNTKRTRGGGPR
jgi:hypothetical protein